MRAVVFRSLLASRHGKLWGWFLLLLGLSHCIVSAGAAPGKPAPGKRENDPLKRAARAEVVLRTRTPVSWNSNTQGECVVSLGRDTGGAVWVGTEDFGVWRCDLRAPVRDRWKQFTRRDGLGDDTVYAVAADRLGRVWVGHVRHGVSVYNGKSWRNYGPLEGPLGERVFDIATCPVDGDVWIATNAGLSRYSLGENRWSHFGRGNGLPTLAPSALAFDKNGNLYLGTQCEGIAIAARDGGYRQWRQVRSDGKMPLAPAGAGLPSDLINDLLAARDGTLYAGTPSGLAWSRDQGRTWKFVRGLDWEDRVRGLQGGPPAGWKPTSGARLLEDYVTCLAEDPTGNLWVGFRQQGFEVIDPATHQRRLQAGYDRLNPQDNDFVAALLPLHGATSLVGRYGHGLSQVGGTYPLPPEAPAAPGKAASAPPHPAPEPVPTLAHLNAMVDHLATVPDGEAAAPVVALEDDWTTQGDWLGRYGRYWACLAAITAPHDFLWGAGWEKVAYNARIGPHHANPDYLRYWVQSLYTTDRRSLELPPLYLHSRVLNNYTSWNVNRRQAEWDDHSEDYPVAHDGPHLYSTITVPAGRYFLSLYCFNKDGHTGNNRRRDYLVRVKQHPQDAPLDQVEGFEQWKELARARVYQFWGGVYKRFLVQGPTTLTLELNRNGSYSTILSAMMLDLPDECPPPYFGTVAEWTARQDERHLPTLKARNFAKGEEAEAAAWIVDALERKRHSGSSWWSSDSGRFYTALARWYRAALKQPAPRARAVLSRRQATVSYYLRRFSLWEEGLKQAGIRPAREIEKALRWDGVTRPISGRGHRTVTEYLEAENRKSGAAPVLRTEQLP